MKRLEVGQMKANTYIVWDDDGEAAIIDPGDDADYVISMVQRNDLKPRVILATHGHFDHVMATLELKLAYNIPFYMHESDFFLLNRMERSAVHFLGIDPGPPADVDMFIEGGSKISVGDLEIEIINTPGHTPGSVSFYIRQSKDIFVGDLIFEGGFFGRTDFEYSDKSRLVKSVHNLCQLAPETTVHPGHGRKFKIQDIPVSR